MKTAVAYTRLSKPNKRGRPGIGLEAQQEALNRFAAAAGGDRLANGLSVSCIALLPLDVGLHIGRRYQPHLVTQRLQFARPTVRRSAGLNSDQARR